MKPILFTFQTKESKNDEGDCDENPEQTSFQSNFFLQENI